MDLLNADGLDESITNQYSGCCGAAFDGSNADGDTTKSNVDYGQLATQALTIGTQVAGAVKAGKESESQSGAGITKKELKSVCGRRPILKKKRAEWQKCADSYISSKQSATSKEKSPSSTDVQNQINTLKAEQKDKSKFLGMPKSVGITVAVLGGIALLVGGVVLIKRINK